MLFQDVVKGYLKGSVSVADCISFIKENSGKFGRLGNDYNWYCDGAIFWAGNDEDGEKFVREVLKQAKEQKILV